MRKTKLLSLLLAGAMTLSLAACGPQKVENSKTSDSSRAVESTGEVTGASSVAQSGEEVAELEEKTIQIWLAGAGKQKDSDKVWAAFNEMLQQYVPNTTVEFTVMSTSEYKEKYAQMLAAGEGVDLAWVANWITGKMDDNIEAGNWMPLDDLVEKYGSGIVDSLSEKVIDFHRSADGKLYYLISWQGLAQNKKGVWLPAEIADKTSATWIDDTRKLVEDWFYSEADVEKYRAVMDQFEAYLETAKKENMLGAGVKYGDFMSWGQYTHSSAVLSKVQEVGVQMFDDTFTVQDLYTTEHFQLFAQYMADWYKAGYIKQDAASADLTGYDRPKNGVINDHTWIIDSHDLWYMGPEAGDKVFSASMGMPAYTIEMDKAFTLTKGDSTAVAIPYCADEPERAMMVLNALYAVPELWQLFVYGIKDEHWTDNGDGTITRLGGETIDDSYGQWNWVIGNAINTLPTSQEGIGTYQKYKDAEATAIENPFAGFKLVQNDEIKAIVAAIKAIDAEYLRQIIYGYHGDNWKSVYDKWMSERKAAGVDNVVAEYQKQLDEYLNANHVTSWDAFRVN